MTTADSLHQIRDQGYCALRAHFPPPLVEACRDAFWPVLLAHLSDRAGALLGDRTVSCQWGCDVPLRGSGHAPLEIAPGAHRLPWPEGVAMQQVLPEPGGILIRHPWAAHRGAPNLTGTPRAPVTIRCVHRWDADDSHQAAPTSRAEWRAVDA